MKKTEIKKIEKLVQELIEKLDQRAEIEVVEDKENEVLNVNLKVEDPGFLIGFHGNTLSSLQLILGLMVFRLKGEWVRVVVDVNDYRAEQSERITQIANNAAQKVRFSGEEVSLTPMTPFERRIIHTVLGENEAVNTRSEGEGSFRYVVITPANQSGVLPDPQEAELPKTEK